MFGRKSLIILGLVLCLSCGTLAKGGRGGGRSSRGYRSSRTRYTSTGTSSGGGGGGLSTSTIVIIIVVVVIAVIVIILYYLCKAAAESEEEEEDDKDFVGGPLVTGAEPITSTVPKRVPSNFRLSEDVFRKVEIPCYISEEEEMALYEQDQIWLREALAEGRKDWSARKTIEYQFDMENKKKKARFLASFCHPFGDNNSCNCCGLKLEEETKWYRCRVCVDVDLCAKCFEDRPNIIECGHAPNHPCAKLQIHETCSKCQCYIYDTKFRCETCLDLYDVYFCLGCYKMGMHEDRHGDHVFKRSNATSYVMQSENSPPDETSALLRGNEKGAQPSAPYTYPPSELPPGPYPTSPAPYTYPPPGVPYEPSAPYPPTEVPSAPPETTTMPVPAVPPPSYADCT